MVLLLSASAVSMPKLSGSWEINFDCVSDISYAHNNGVLNKSEFKVKFPKAIISQSERFFSIASDRINDQKTIAHNPITSHNKELWLCVLAENGTNFVCTDSDEPATVQGVVEGEMVKFLYVESGSKESRHKNPFNVCHGIAARNK